MQCWTVGLIQSPSRVNWTRLCESCGPNARIDDEMTYDAADGYVLLFGGAGGTASTAQWYNDTWAFKGGNWTQLHPRTSPPTLLDAGMVYDAADGYVVLFGGAGATKVNYEVSNYTWKFNGGEWTNITSIPSPPQCNRPNMAYDAADGYVVLFSGWNPNVVTPVNNTTEFIGGDLRDTWKFSGGRWTNITPAIEPEARDSAFMAYDAHDGYVVMFGGEDTNFTPLNDTWEFRGGKWTQLFPGPGPTAKELGGVAYDPELKSVITFGGDSGKLGSFSNETWGFSDGNWTRLYPLFSPEPRAGLGLAYDQADGYLVLFGGGPLPNNYFGSYNDTWVLKIIPQQNVSSSPWWQSYSPYLIGGGFAGVLVVVGVFTWRLRRRKLAQVQGAVGISGVPPASNPDSFPPTQT